MKINAGFYKVIMLMKKRIYKDVEKIAIGTGGKVYPGWWCGDINRRHPEEHIIDATQKLPFEDSSVSFLHTENMLEHITFQQNRCFLKEIKRILKPGGIARLVTHSITPMMGLYTDTPTELQRDYIKWGNKRFSGFFDHDGDDNPVFSINRAFNCHGHKFLFDERTLRDLIKSIGFTKIEKCEINKSKYKELNDMERHGEVIPSRLYHFEALIVEVTK